MNSTRPNLFIGADIVSVPRIARLLGEHPDRFKSHSYSKDEVNYCEGKANPAIHFAGRFAAKEAVKKALLSTGQVTKIPLKYIRIKNRRDGAPIVELSTEIEPKFSCQISISHTDDMALAFAVAELIK